METTLCSSFLSKIEDQLDRADHLISLVPFDQLEWTPPMPNGFSVGTLLAHLMECLAGFCAVLHASNPDRLHHFLDLKRLTADKHIDCNEAQLRLKVYQNHIREGFAVINDSDLSSMIPTVFVPNGEPLLNLLLINSEHLASHKYQLFIYLRMIGLHVSSSDLYHFSGQ